MLCFILIIEALHLEAEFKNYNDDNDEDNDDDDDDDDDDDNDDDDGWHSARMNDTTKTYHNSVRIHDCVETMGNR